MPEHWNRFFQKKFEEQDISIKNILKWVIGIYADKAFLTKNAYVICIYLNRPPFNSKFKTLQVNLQRKIYHIEKTFYALSFHRLHFF